MATRDATADPIAATNGGPTSSSRLPVKIDDRHVNSSYANFCRVTCTPEELVLDFGLNSQPFGVKHDEVAVSQRVVMNFYTAKRMLNALQVAIQRHETAFGVLETEIQKRVLPGVSPPDSGLE